IVDLFAPIDRVGSWQVQPRPVAPAGARTFLILGRTTAMPSEADQATSRRKFLQFLAASPLLAASDLAAMANETPSRLPDPMMWAPRNIDKLISTPREAINVFDFEP